MASSKTTKYLINIFGAMATGKTTLAKKLAETIDRVYLVDYDIVKGQITSFSSSRDRAAATKISYDTLASVARNGFTIIALLPPPSTEKEYLRIVNVAQDNQMKLINIELVAPVDTLVPRYVNRLEEWEVSGVDIRKMRTVEEFKDAVSRRYYRPENTVTFDSSLLSADEVFEQIINLL